MRRFVVIGLLVSACGSSLTPIEPPPEPGGTLAVQFTTTYEPGFWEAGSHGYRLELSCPNLGASSDPPVMRFAADPAERLFGDRVWLRFDGPSTTRLSPSNLTNIHPDQPTGAVLTLVGLTDEQADLAVTDCDATVVYDGNDPEPLAPGQPFSP